MFAIDFDGVIANMCALKSSWIYKRIGKTIPVYNCDRTRCVPIIGEKLYNDMSEEVYGSELSLEAKPILDVQESLATLSELGLLYLLSARKEINMKYVHRWLLNKDLDHYFEQIICTYNKSKISIAENLECKVLIDDDQRHLLSNSKTDILLILFKMNLKNDPTYNENYKICTTWPDIVSKSIERVKGLS